MGNTYPTWGKPKTIDEICALGNFCQLHPTMQQRVRQLIEASEGRVGLGVGFRSEDEQRTLFLSRYVVSEHGSTMWDGKRWAKKNQGDATAAPPGRSMHELGLAADLAGDHAWVVANSSRFALKHFAWVNNEPWHVQPFELPNSRRQYERAGSPWRLRPDAGQQPTSVVTSEPAGEPPAEVPIVEIVPEMRGPAVGQLQDVLIKLGLMKDCVANRDEYYGPGTQKVIRAFQSSHGLRVDAKVGPKTWAALLSA